MELTSRNFLTEAGIAAGTAALISMTSTGIASATEESALPESVHWSWDIKPELPTDDQITETYDCDICVAGLGVAGPWPCTTPCRRALRLSPCKNSNACTMAVAGAGS